MLNVIKFPKKVSVAYLDYADMPPNTAGKKCAVYELSIRCDGNIEVNQFYKLIDKMFTPIL